MKNIIIIGNGISGITAARHIRKLSQHKITVISSETKYFFSRTALMYVYMGHMKFEHIKPYEDKFWEKNKIDLVFKSVVDIIPANNQILLEDGSKLNYDELILALGSKPNKFGWPGQDLIGVQGLYSYQDLQQMETNTKGISHAVIVGGGLIGVEMAEMLLSRDIRVTFLVRESSFWNIVLPQEESDLLNRHIREHHVDLQLNTLLKSINGKEDGVVESVTTDKEQEINCQFVGLTTGVRPNIDFIKDNDIATDQGVLVDEYLCTNMDNIYAIGDCAQFNNPLTDRKSIEQVWYTGRMMGETVAHTICGKKTAYRPGIWFNSAKFFDIEYQTYGNVWPALRQGEGQFYWEHHSGKKCLKFIYDQHSRVILGVNSLGIRLRHEIFDRWINNRQTIDFVIQNLKKANFDPEFFVRYEQAVNEAFEKQQNKVTY